MSEQAWIGHAAECGCPLVADVEKPLSEWTVIHYEGCEFHDPETCAACAEMEQSA